MRMIFFKTWTNNNDFYYYTMSLPNIFHRRKRLIFLHHTVYHRLLYFYVCNKIVPLSAYNSIHICLELWCRVPICVNNLYFMTYTKLFCCCCCCFHLLVCQSFKWYTVKCSTLFQSEIQTFLGTFLHKNHIKLIYYNVHYHNTLV